jgi:hypothetical protein
MRYAVVGSREFAKPDLVRRCLDMVLKKGEPFTIVSGGAEGPDTVAKEWGDANGVQVTVFPADWDRLGDKAGPARNAQIVDASDAMLAFWDGESNGTLDSIKRARSRKGYGRVLVWLG